MQSCRAIIAASKIQAAMSPPVSARAIPNAIADQGKPTEDDVQKPDDAVPPPKQHEDKYRHGETRHQRLPRRGASESGVDRDLERRSDTTASTRR